MSSSRCIGLLALFFLSFLSFPGSAFADVGDILALERRIHARAIAVNPSGNRVEDEKTEVAPDQGPWVAADASSARADEVESVSFVSTAYQNSRGVFVEGSGFFQAQGWATSDTIRVEPRISGESVARSVYDLTFTLNFPREIHIRGSLRSESQSFEPAQGGALLLLTGDQGEVLRRQVGPMSETLDLSYDGFLEPGTYRILVRANRGGGRRFSERLGIGRSSFDFALSFESRPLVLTVSPLVRGQEATFSVRDADPNIQVTLYATKNGLCLLLFCSPIIPFNPPIVTREGVTDGNGSLDFSVLVPGSILEPVIHCLAIQTRGGPTGTFSASSGVVEVQISR